MPPRWERGIRQICAVFDRHLHQRLRRAIAKIGRLMTPRFPGEPLTISIGIALLHPNDTPATLLARADHALYQAKQRGRDRIELETDTSTNN
ncbi:MAG: diguanylate cyclase [Candidatus Sedimenticola endophacoides]